jgi:HEPN/Toprim N-terminal domain 1
MGSYAELKFDELLVLSSKSVVPDMLISLFQEADRRVAEGYGRRGGRG